MHTFDLTIDTPGILPYVITAAGVALLLAGLLIVNTWWMQTVLVILGAVGGVYGVVEITDYTVGLTLRRVAQMREIKYMDAHLIGIKYATELEIQKQNTIGRLANLKPEHLEYLHLAGDLPAVRIGTRVTWHVGGTDIPVTFAAEWYEQLTQAAHGHLPSQSAFDQHAHREDARRWHSVIVAELVRMGAVIDPGGPFPARWFCIPEKRAEMLEAIGLASCLRYLEASEETEIE
jgi:hypothetical protein